MKAEDRPIFHRRRWLLPVVVTAWLGILVCGWARSMYHVSEFRICPKGWNLVLAIQRGSIGVDLRMNPLAPLSSRLFSADEELRLTPWNQETVFPAAALAHYKFDRLPTTQDRLTLPIWLVCLVSISVGLVLPITWKRLRLPDRNLRLGLGWLAGWTAACAAIVFAGRWWSLKTPRTDETQSFVLTGSADSGAVGKFTGVAYHSDGSPYAFLQLDWGDFGFIETGPDGRFEASPAFERFHSDRELFNQYLSGDLSWSYVGGEPIHISCDPDHPLFWEIREKAPRIK